MTVSSLDLARAAKARKHRLVMEAKGVTPDNARVLAAAGYGVVAYFDVERMRISRVGRPGSAGAR
jgi:hypothetical protein